MKSFRSLFYTRPAKVIMILLLFAVSYFIGNCQLEYFRLYKEDKESFNNAMIQMDSFDYQTSYYFRNTVEETVENIVALAMNYGEIFEKKMSPADLLEYYTSIGDSTFPEIYENIVALKGFSFAFVNHETKVVYSSIPELNCKMTSTDVRRHFGVPGKTLLIARSCKSPYFETKTFMDYAEFIRRCSEKYDVNFDIYIYFGDEAIFDEQAQQCSELHFTMREKIEKLNNSILILIGFLILIGSCLLTVTGRHEAGGKVYLTTMNRLPNDLLITIYSIVLMCIFSLYRTSFYMVINYNSAHEDLWYTRPERFYTNRVLFCIVFFICIFVDLLCIVKRSYKAGNFTENMYVYPYVKRFKEKINALVKNKSRKDKKEM